ncbi:MAG: MFS transporter [SAR202 cluster bacterium]|nr:MFS transporter [SAR202 cluster bacterium]
MNRSLRRLNYGHVILASGFLVLFFASGTRFAFGLVLKPLSEELDISRSSLSSAFTVFMIVSALAMPIVGRLIDRYDIRWTMGIGAVLSSAAIVLMGRVNSQWELFALYGVALAIGSASVSVAPVSVLMSRWFPTRRGLAASAAISGNGIGQLVIITLMASFLATLGWRTSYTILGAAFAAVVVPIAIGVVRSHPPATIDAPGTKSIEGAPVAEESIFHSRNFWLLVAMFGVCGVQDFFMATHIVAFAQDQGVGDLLAGNMLAFMGLFGLAGVLLAGAMADAHGASKPTLLCFVLRIGLFAYIPLFQDTPSIVAVALLYGFTFTMTAPLTVVFASNIFGTARLGTVSGLINMAHQVAGGLGALFGAIIFDWRDSYDLAFVVMLGLAFVGLAATAALNERRQYAAVA